MRNQFISTNTIKKTIMFLWNYYAQTFPFSFYSPQLIIVFVLSLILSSCSNTTTVSTPSVTISKTLKIQAFVGSNLLGAADIVELDPNGTDKLVANIFAVEGTTVIKSDISYTIVPTLSSTGVSVEDAGGLYKIKVTSDMYTDENDNNYVLTVTIGNTTKTRKIYIKRKIPIIAVKSLALTRIIGQEDTKAIVGGSTVDLTTVLTVTVEPTNATDSNVTWSISPVTNIIATLTPQGILTPVAEGTVNILVISVSDTGVSSIPVPFTVEASVPVTGITLTRKIGQENSKATVGLDAVDLSTIFEVNIIPNKATDKSVTWSISPVKDAVATLTPQGELTPVAVGIVNVLVTSVSDTGVSSITVPFTVEAFVQLIGLNLSRKSGQENTKAYLGANPVDLTSIFTVLIVPNNATNREVTWSIFTPMDTIATLSPEGIFTPLTVGTVNIIVTSVTGLSSTPVPFTIVVPVTALTLARITGQEDTKGLVGEGTVDLTAVFATTIIPSNATDSNVTWSISPPMDNLATLTPQGILTPIDTGNVNIKITSVSNTGVSSTPISFTIEVPVTGLSLTRISSQENTIAKVGGGTVDLTSVFALTVTPTNATDSSVIWTIFPTMNAVATLSITGVLTPIVAGTVNVIVTSVSYTGVSSTPVSFTIQIPVVGLTLSRISSQENTKASVGSGTLDLTSVFEVIVTPINATDTRIIWSISPLNDNVATLSPNGILTPIGAGIVNIIVSSISESGVSSTAVPFTIE